MSLRRRRRPHVRRKVATTSARAASNALASCTGGMAVDPAPQQTDGAVGVRWLLSP
jgi:hypothetical protein